jgi:hypothetical protein
MTLSIDDTQDNSINGMLSVVFLLFIFMLSVIMLSLVTLNIIITHYAECHSSECRGAHDRNFYGQKILISNCLIIDWNKSFMTNIADHYS